MGPIYRRLTRLRVGFTVAAVALVMLAAAPALADITYAYDSAGRLVAISDGAGKVITYSHDSDGNILQVQVNSGAVAIAEVYPTVGRVGTAVTIYGIGFSATPSQDTVTFNGTQATVTSATTTTISTTVPTGATTGAISVTSPSGSATGPVFTVNTH